jgi:hypothetical protein
MPPTNRRPCAIDTSRHFCPHAGCAYRGWLGLGNLRANGHPSGGPWRQLYCRSCHGYLLETHGTMFHGKRLSVELIVRVLACLAEGTFEQDDMDNWQECTRTGHGVVARRYALNLQMGLGHEGYREGLQAWTSDSRFSESNHRQFYRRWAQLMVAKTWAAVESPGSAALPGQGGVWQARSDAP